MINPLVFIKNLVQINEKLIHMIKKILFYGPANFNKTLISQSLHHHHHHETIIMTIHLLHYYFMNLTMNHLGFIHSFSHSFTLPLPPSYFISGYDYKSHF